MTNGFSFNSQRFYINFRFDSKIINELRMNNYEIVLDIKEQISKTNQGFTNNWGRLYFKGLLEENIDSLEIILKKITSRYKFYKIISIFFACLLILVSLIAHFNIIDSVRMNRSGILIISTMVMIANTFRYHKVVTILGNKIYLLKLLDKMGRN